MILRSIILALAMASVCAAETPRPVIYQLMVRTFGNINETRKTNGTMEENGCGKFAHITPAALASLKQLGITHIWLTGVLEQASGTAYPGRPADDPDILKGIAGSPYAIKDYFDVCPDYAMNPEKRLDEFKALLGRCREAGFKVIIDFVPNHVARSYESDVRPDLSFGKDDDKSAFFSRDNHFFYLQPDHPGGGAPLKLPATGEGCDGKFPPETDFGRVTGNNVVSWAPAISDWYETVKLNYGHDFTSGRDTSQLAATDAVPKTWGTMDEILGYWQEMGVDGFRVDMAHMVPMEFWRWSVKRSRERDPQVFFCAEAYDNDPAKLTEGHVLDELLKAGFDAVYDDPSYDILEAIHESDKWANDLDPLTFTGDRFHQSLRYAENHDEVRLANPARWGGLGMKVGKPVSAILFSMGRGPIMIYNGQEVGEPALGEEGFGGDDARTSIFDYWSMPEFCKWLNGGKFDGGRLSDEQKALREWYGKLIGITRNPAFAKGGFYGLNHANKDNPDFGRVGGETASGHWLYAFLRRDAESGQTFLVVANLHGTETLRGVKITIPEDARTFLGHSGDEPLAFTDRLDSEWSGSIVGEGLALPDLAPCSALLLEIKR
ncbi:alpha-amylase [Akkermansiaceae bacterium]|nr:alpha-amylase [Akkermansiaceae bacterium]